MVGIVVVSHSRHLADAAVELARQMVGDDGPPIEVAAGIDGGLGTDAVAVAAAIQRADQASNGSGVLVITDLGSALLSSEMAVELADGVVGDVLLSRAPFVEGLVAAVVQAGIGKSLAEVESEAVAALTAKAAQLGPPADAASEATAEATAEAADADDAAEDDGARAVSTVDVRVVNPAGLHARPAALFAREAAKLPVEVSITNLDTGAGPAAADSMLELMTIGVRQGQLVRLSVELTPDGSADSVGADDSAGEAALETLAALIRSGLGERTGG